MAQKMTLDPATAPSHLSVVRPTDCDAGSVRPGDQGSDRITVELLGGLRIRAGGVTLGPGDLGGAKPRHILLALLLQRGAPVSRDRLVSMLWGASPPSSALGTLAAYVCVLRKSLEPGGKAQDSLITTIGGCYAIDMRRVDLDIIRYERLVSAALHPLTSATEALPALQQAMALAASSLLPEELDSQWLGDVCRTHDQQIHQDLVAAALKVAVLPGDIAERWARRALQSDPLDESAWYALLVGIEANGQHADGLQAYDQCRRLFAAELGCAPGPGLQELHARLLRGANENDDELSDLLDAVVRVHMAGRLSTSPPMTALVGGGPDRFGHNASVDHAMRALNLLLHRVDARFGCLAQAPG
jgi:DNA-binding SARP family transcriptional activator